MTEESAQTHSDSGTYVDRRPWPGSKEKLTRVPWPQAAYDEMVIHTKLLESIRFRLGIVSTLAVIILISILLRACGLA